MNINPIKNHLHTTFNLLEHQTNNFLTAQDQKITALVLVIFSVIAICLIAYKFYSSASKLDSKDDIESEEEPSSQKSYSEIMKKGQMEFGSIKDRGDGLRYFNVVVETGILKNPKAYLKLWGKERGGSEKIRYPEDHVMSFFKKELL